MQPSDNRYVERYHDDGALVRHGNDDLTRDARGRPDYAGPIICPLVGVHDAR